MPFEILPAPLKTSARLGPVEARRAPLFCFGLLTIACALASFAFACATPFAALAVIASAMLRLRTAIFMVAAAWFVNQAIGFGLLGYPVDANTILWGLVIGAAAVAATAMSALVLRSLPQTTSPVALGSALMGAYAAYELVLVAATPLLGGAGDFTMAIVGRLGVLNILWLIGVVAACEVVRLLTATRRRQLQS